MFGIPRVVFPSMVITAMEAGPSGLFRRIHLDSIFRIQKTYRTLELAKRNQKNSNGMNASSPNILGSIRVRKQKGMKISPLLGSSRLSNQ